jgi:hypothetical protein
MNPRREPAQYEIQVQGHLDEHWAAWFGGLALVREDDGTTTLRGTVADQAELHGLLAKVRDLGTPLLSVKAADAPVRTGDEPVKAAGAPVRTGDEPVQRRRRTGTHGA